MTSGSASIWPWAKATGHTSDQPTHFHIVRSPRYLRCRGPFWYRCLIWAARNGAPPQS